MKLSEDEQTKLAAIRGLFDAEEEPQFPNREQQVFLQERAELEEEALLSFEVFIERYDEIIAYGLEDRLLDYLEGFITILLEIDYENFTNSEFYKQFKDKKQVKSAIEEFERRADLDKS